MEPTLGHLEEMVLLVVMVVADEAYGITIREAYMKQTGNQISLSAIHTVLRRLEKKGFINSQMGGATQDRGGRRKRLYSITRAGHKSLETLHEKRLRLWQMAPKFNWS